MTIARGIRPNIKPIPGQRFQMLTVVSAGRGYVDSYYGRPRRNWVCKCDCGRTTIVRESNLKNGHTHSCGCQRFTSDAWKHRKTNLRHGDARKGHVTPEWLAWRGLMDRCLNPSSRSFVDYGGRGISICKRWVDSFEAFLADVGRRPGPGYSIDRKNNDRGYEPGNVRWATATQQMRNRRNVIMAKINGVTVPAITLAEEYGVRAETMRNRVRCGWSPERAATTPTQARGRTV